MAKKFVSGKDETVVMFKNPLLEKLTRIHWAVPLILFVPVVVFFMYRSIFMLHLHTLPIFILFISGVFTWTLVEYCLHRFFFHTHFPGKMGERLSFIIHGVHHDYPNDSKRLVMVPSLSIPLALFFYILFYILLGNAFVSPFFAGVVTGYLFYDMTHYAVHHANIKNKFWVQLKLQHMRHHYQQPDLGFGVSSKLWDYVFDTRLEEKKSS